MVTITVSEPVRALMEHALRSYIGGTSRHEGLMITVAGHNFTGSDLTDAYDAVADAPRNHLRAFLDLSTSHLRPETREMWTESFTAEHFPINVLCGVNGWVMYVPDTDDGWDYRLGTELFEIFAYARAQGVEYVMFDADAPAIDGLPIFEDAAEVDPGIDASAAPAPEREPAAAEFSREEVAFIRALHVQSYEAGEIARLAGKRFGAHRTRAMIAVCLADQALEAADAH